MNPNSFNANRFGVLGIFKNETGGGVDGDRARASGGVGLLARVQGQSGDAWFGGIGHAR